VGTLAQLLNQSKPAYVGQAQVADEAGRTLAGDCSALCTSLAVFTWIPALQETAHHAAVRLVVFDQQESVAPCDGRSAPRALPTWERERGYMSSSTVTDISHATCRGRRCGRRSCRRAFSIRKLQSPPQSQPRKRRVTLRPPCSKASKILGSSLGLDCDPGVSDLDHQPVVPRFVVVTVILPTVGVKSRRAIRFQKICARRSRIRPDEVAIGHAVEAQVQALVVDVAAAARLGRVPKSVRARRRPSQ